MLKELTLYGIVDKVDIAVRRLKLHEPAEGYYVAFSGGKDSVVIYHLCKMAGVKFDAHYSVVTVDPPEHVQFIKRKYSDAWEGREIPRYKDGTRASMWNLIPKKGMPPTRLARYCCQVLKENGGIGRFVVTGVRAAESARRKKRKIIEQCKHHKGKRYIHPVFDWSDSDIWEFIRKYDIPYSPLYDKGYKRVGCVMCPFASKNQRLQEQKDFPQINKLYLKAFEKMIEKRKSDGKPCEWKTAEEVYNWWLYGKVQLKEDDPSLPLFGALIDETDV